jgi:hypothetical protein
MLSASSLLFGLEAPACGGQVFQPEGSSMVGVASVIGVPTAGKPAADDIWLAGVWPPDGTPTGKISVFSSRFFFGLGSGAAQN